MKRVLALTSALALIAAPGAFAFPEQPAEHTDGACLVLLTNPDRALHTIVTPDGIVIDIQHMSAKAASILLPQLADACFGAP